MSASLRNDMIDRYGNAFARALGVFVRELARADGMESADAATANDDEELLRAVRARAKENDRLERRGRLKPIPFDVKAVRQTLAERIRATLGKRRMTQAQLAKALKITPANITRILKSPEKSKVETLERIAAALHVDVADFF
jgi:DNA-binding Xre family transcriptional regulator